MRRVYALLMLTVALIVPALGCTGAAENAPEPQPLEAIEMPESTNTTAN